ncbi:cytochrome P450 [Trichophaea hybrida]|nr:cytochrome P450 [Trichophaea hybrida]
MQIEIPAYGVPPGPLGSWIAALRFVRNSAELIEGGVQKYGPSGTSFKISTPARWVVVATSEAVLNELKDADPRVLSMQAAANERNSISYTLSSTIHSNPYHVDILTKNLTQRLSKVLPDVVDELRRTFEKNVPSGIGEEWVPINTHALMLKCISSTTNRILVGLPLSRDQEYLDCLVELSKMVSRAGLVIDLAPRVLKSFIAWCMIPRGSAFKIFLDKLGPVFEERRKRIAELGDGWTDRPNDAAQWVVETAPQDASVYELCVRILYLDFSAIHTSSISITQALYDLATHPEFQTPIRDEIESVLAEHGGWTKPALTQMKKLDSTLRESQRLHPVTTATMMRMTMKPYTLADGTRLPKGQWVVAPAWASNRSAEQYDDPLRFDAFRFSSAREEAGSEVRYQLASPDKGYLSFGMGKHACPGRFFAAAELKVLLAHVICNYEFKLDAEGSKMRPHNSFFSFLCSPDFTARLMFRVRTDAGNQKGHSELSGH